MLLNRSIQPKSGGEPGPKGDTGLPALMYIGPTLMTSGDTVDVNDTVNIANTMFNRTPNQYDEFITILKNGTGDTDIWKQCLLQCTAINGANATFKIIFAGDVTVTPGSVDTKVSYLVTTYLNTLGVEDDGALVIQMLHSITFDSEAEAQNAINSINTATSIAEKYRLWYELIYTKFKTDSGLVVGSSFDVLAINGYVITNLISAIFNPVHTIWNITSTKFSIDAIAPDGTLVNKDYNLADMGEFTFAVYFNKIGKI